RRMLHETVVHRADVELLVGVSSHIADEVGIDGVDEVLENLPAVVDLVGHGWPPARAGHVVALIAPGGPSWRIEVAADGFSWTHGGAGAADASVEAVPGALELLLYGRRPLEPERLRVVGDASLLDW